ncbi:MAG: UPF0271 protein, partial [Lentisphaeria bacterium]
GGHTGDEDSMLATLNLARQHNVQIGAHPSYPDRTNFGRISMTIAADALENALKEQISALIQYAKASGTQVSYIKPHGALYHDVLLSNARFASALKVARVFKLPLLIQALPSRDSYIKKAAELGADLLFEAFADRAYCDTGKLVTRQFAHAVHSNMPKTLAQAHNLAFKGGTFSENKRWLAIAAQTLCVHSDSPDTIATIIAIRECLDNPINGA